MNAAMLFCGRWLPEPARKPSESFVVPPSVLAVATPPGAAPGPAPSVADRGAAGMP